MHVANILIDVYTADSAVVRAMAATANHLPRAALHADAARVFVNDAAMRVEAAARQALATMADGDELREAPTGLRRLIPVLPVNTTTLRRRLAEAIALGGYVF